MAGALQNFFWDMCTVHLEISMVHFGILDLSRTSAQCIKKSYFSRNESALKNNFFS